MASFITHYYMADRVAGALQDKSASIIAGKIGRASCRERVSKTV